MQYLLRARFKTLQKLSLLARILPLLLEIMVYEKKIMPILSHYIRYKRFNFSLNIFFFYSYLFGKLKSSFFYLIKHISFLFYIMLLRNLILYL